MRSFYDFSPIGIRDNVIPDDNLDHNEIDAIANYIINAIHAYNDKQGSLETKVFSSSKRLQKIIFFSDVLYMLEHKGESMIKEDYYAWPSGPAIPHIYREFLEYKDGNMYPIRLKNSEGLPQEITSTIDRVLQATNSIGTAQLVEESQKSEPWQDAWRKSLKEFKCVSKISIYKFYLKGNTPYNYNFIDNEQEKAN